MMLIYRDHSSLEVDAAGDRKHLQCPHGPRRLAAATTVPSWTIPRPIRQRHRQTSCYCFLTR